jgi:hypothetical protein
MDTGVMTMEINETHKLEGRIRVYQRKKGGEWELVAEGKNIITNNGKKIIGDRWGSSSSTYITYFGVGNGTATPAVTDTYAVFNGDGAAHYYKAVDSYSYNTGTNVATMNCYLNTAENTVAAITKFCLLTAAAGTLFQDVKFNAITKDTTNELWFEYNMTIA